MNQNKKKLLSTQKEINFLHNIKNNISKKINESTCSCTTKPLINKLNKVVIRINELNSKKSELNNQIEKIQNNIEPKNKCNNKALIIGINYYGRPNNRLNGCVNDARDIRKLLINKFKFNPNCITLLIDEPKNIQQTKKNMIINIRKFILNAKPNEKLWFFYSGHGLQIKDRNGDEKDSKDEVMISSDLQIIKDDFLYSMFSKLNKRAHLFCLMDLCNSATIGDLQYTYLNLSKPSKNNKKQLKNKNITIISSSRDDQLSYDAYIGGKYQGILTHSFKKFITRGVHLKWLVLQIRKYIKNLDIDQKTILSSSYLIRPGKNTLIFK